MVDEKRDNIRDPVYTIKAELIDGEGDPILMHVRDLSKTGALLERTDASVDLPAEGADVQLTITWPLNTAIPPVKVTAKVVRATEKGIGVLFLI